MDMNLQVVEKQVMEFDKMKFIDEDGKEKISGRDLAKALGYTEWRNFKSAVARTNEQIKNSGKGDMLVESTTHIKINKPNGGVENRKNILSSGTFIFVENTLMICIASSIYIQLVKMLI